MNLKPRFFSLAAIILLLAPFQAVLASESGLLSKASTLQSSVLRKTQPRNYINLEIGGRGGIYSLGFERRFSAQTTLGVGLSHYSLELNPTIAKTDVSITIIPLYANFYFGRNKLNYFVTSGASLVFLESNANISLNDALGELTFNFASGESDAVSLTTNSELVSNNSTRIVVPLPSIGFGLEYRASGALMRISSHSFYTDRFYHWAGFTIGGGF